MGEFVRLEKRAAASIKTYEWQLGLAIPTIGRRPFSKITAQEVLVALKTIERTKRYYTATSVRTTYRQVFRFAIATARAERDVCGDLRGALVTPKFVHRAAITTPNEAGALLRSIDDYEGDVLTRIAMELLAYVFVRNGDLHQW